MFPTSHDRKGVDVFNTHPRPSYSRPYAEIGQRGRGLISKACSAWLGFVAWPFLQAGSRES
jgi:hypothetical protein